MGAVLTGPQVQVRHVHLLSSPPLGSVSPMPKQAPPSSVSMPQIRTSTSPPSLRGNGVLRASEPSPTSDLPTTTAHGTGGGGCVFWDKWSLASPITTSLSDSVVARSMPGPSLPPLRSVSSLIGGGEASLYDGRLLSCEADTGSPILQAYPPQRPVPKRKNDSSRSRSHSRKEAASAETAQPLPNLALNSTLSCILGLSPDKYRGSRANPSSISNGPPPSPAFQEQFRSLVLNTDNLEPPGSGQTSSINGSTGMLCIGGCQARYSELMTALFSTSSPYSSLPTTGSSSSSSPSSSYFSPVAQCYMAALGPFGVDADIIPSKMSTYASLCETRDSMVSQLSLNFVNSVLPRILREQGQSSLASMMQLDITQGLQVTMDEIFRRCCKGHPRACIFPCGGVTKSPSLQSFLDGTSIDKGYDGSLTRTFGLRRSMSVTCMAPLTVSEGSSNRNRVRANLTGSSDEDYVGNKSRSDVFHTSLRPEKKTFSPPARAIMRGPYKANLETEYCLDLEADLKPCNCIQKPCVSQIENTGGPPVSWLLHELLDLTPNSPTQAMLKTAEFRKKLFSVLACTNGNKTTNPCSGITCSCTSCDCSTPHHCDCECSTAVAEFICVISSLIPVRKISSFLVDHSSLLVECIIPHCDSPKVFATIMSLLVNIHYNFGTVATSDNNQESDSKFLLSVISAVLDVVDKFIPEMCLTNTKSRTMNLQSPQKEGTSQKLCKQCGGSKKVPQMVIRPQLVENILEIMSQCLQGPPAPEISPFTSFLCPCPDRATSWHKHKVSKGLGRPGIDLFSEDFLNTMQVGFKSVRKILSMTACNEYLHYVIPIIKHSLARLPPGHCLTQMLLPEIIAYLHVSLASDRSLHSHSKVLQVSSVTLAVLRKLTPANKENTDELSYSCHSLVETLFRHWRTNSMVHAILLKIARAIIKKPLPSLFSALRSHPQASEIEAEASMKPYYCMEDTEKLKTMIAEAFHGTVAG